MCNISLISVFLASVWALIHCKTQTIKSRLSLVVIKDNPTLIIVHLAFSKTLFLFKCIDSQLTPDAAERN